ncbi:MAG: hypothetical protein U9O90_10020 [Euryarchaeota archaeon]|nr:hypothetical protein [Euryarchaeota archaeon]
MKKRTDTMAPNRYFSQIEIFKPPKPKIMPNILISLTAKTQIKISSIIRKERCSFIGIPPILPIQ